MDKIIARKAQPSTTDPVAWMVGVTATGVAAAVTFLGTALIAM